MEFPQIDGYEIIGLISSAGGMSSGVYRAVFKRGPRREVAIKELKFLGSQDPKLIEFFKKEAKKEANFYLYHNHPRLMKLRGSGFAEQGDNYYIIMELVPGMSVREKINQIGPITTERTIPLFLKVLEAIGYLHSQNILHLDIKPDNIMLQNDDEIKIIDMGISTDLNNIDEFVKRAGTPLYKSPEQIDGDQLGIYTDIWGLGVTLFEMLTAKVPFGGGDTSSREASYRELYYNIKNSPVPRVVEEYPWISDDMQEILEKALAKKPNDRYHSCAEFADDLLKIIYT